MRGRSSPNEEVSQAEVNQKFLESNPGGEEYVSDVLKLTVSSDEENFNFGTDQLTFPELTNSTFSPNNHLQPLYHHQLEAKINVDIVWRDQPDLTDDSEDEGEIRDVAYLTDSSDGGMVAAKMRRRTTRVVADKNVTEVCLT